MNQIWDILALDLAIRLGWARGAPGTQPRCGSVTLAGKGASHGAICKGLIVWLSDLLAQAPRPDIIVFEAPLPVFAKRGQRNANADRILSGLCFVAEGIAHCRGIYDVREASAAAVRHHFIGQNYKRDKAKRYTIERCRELGWLEQADDDAADALALWDFQCCCIAPETGLRSTRLFGSMPFGGQSL
jgi:hypothetical protein